jgi:hypothetical protein
MLFFDVAERLHCRPYTRGGLFEAWALARVCAAVLCSVMPFFLFFFSQNGIFIKVRFLLPLSIFANFYHFLSNITRKLFEIYLGSFIYPPQYFRQF